MSAAQEVAVTTEAPKKKAPEAPKKKAPEKKAPEAPKKEAKAKTRRTSDIEVVRKYIKQLILYKFGTLTAYAEKEGVSLQYVSNVMSGNKAIPEYMYKRFKIAHIVNEYWETTG